MLNLFIGYLLLNFKIITPQTVWFFFFCYSCKKGVRAVIGLKQLMLNIE